MNLGPYLEQQPKRRVRSWMLQFAPLIKLVNSRTTWVVRWNNRLLIRKSIVLALDMWSRQLMWHCMKRLGGVVVSLIHCLQFVDVKLRWLPLASSEPHYWRSSGILGRSGCMRGGKRFVTGVEACSLNRCKSRIYIEMKTPSFFKWFIPLVVFWTPRCGVSKVNLLQLI